MGFARKVKDWPRFRRNWLFNRLCDIGLFLTRVCRNFESWGLTRHERDKLVKITAILFGLVEYKERSEQLLSQQRTIQLTLEQ